MNRYDSFNVWRTYGVGDPTPAVDSSTFAEMQALGYWLETSKMHSNLTGSMLGGPLLQAVSDALQAAALAASTGNATSQVRAIESCSPEAAAAAAAATDFWAELRLTPSMQVYYKVRHVSAHYNTQLGLLSALGLDTFAPAAATPWLRKLPSLAALMAFELHLGSAGELEVRLVMQDGPAAEYQTIPLPCSDGSEGTAGHWEGSTQRSRWAVLALRSESLPPSPLLQARALWRLSERMSCRGRWLMWGPGATPARTTPQRPAKRGTWRRPLSS